MDCAIRNLYDHMPAAGECEHFEELLKHANVRIERIVSNGHSSPEDFWYDQADGEWVAVLAGCAALVFEGDADEHVMQPGDWVFIPPHQKHRVAWTDPNVPTLWLAVFVSNASEA